MRHDLENKADVTLMPGEAYITDKPLIITTILGSCLSFVLYSKRRRLAALSHAQLPMEKTHHCCVDNCPVKCNAATEDNPLKYVAGSTETLIDTIQSLGVAPHELDVKIFGGADVLKVAYPTKSIGKQNIEMAHILIDKYKLKLVAEDTGGKQGRKIVLNAGIGDVWVKKIVNEMRDKRDDRVGLADYLNKLK